MVDGDVECPNDHLLLGVKLGRPQETVLIDLPQLIKDRCQRCGLCVKHCRFHAIFKPKGDFPIFFEDFCGGCGVCWRICPYQAIKTRRKKIGEIFENKIGRDFLLITGSSLGVVEETGRIVSQTIEFAERRSRELKSNYLLLDTGVGIHCNVLRALFVSDLVFVVTESTPLGAYDLELLLSLLRKMKKPAKIVLNQANLGRKELIEEIAKKWGIKIEWQIPFSSRLFHAYLKGEMGRLEVL